MRHVEHFDAGSGMIKVLDEENRRMLRAYGNHPSFLLLAPTNEPAGHYLEQVQNGLTSGEPLIFGGSTPTGTGRPSIPAGGADRGNDFLIIVLAGRGDGLAVIMKT